MLTKQFDGYVTDGKGKSDKLILELSLNFNIDDADPLKFSLRLSEAGKKMEKSREMGVTLTASEWRELIAGMQEHLKVAEESLN
jgi:hypothetical protein